MSDSTTKQILDRMLKSGKLSSTTLGELREFDAELAKGALDPADAAYVQALARRLGFAGSGARGRRKDADPDADDMAEEAAVASEDAEPDDLEPAADWPRGEPDSAEVLAAVRAAVDALCAPEQQADDDPDREVKARLHAALRERLDAIEREFG